MSPSRRLWSAWMRLGRAINNVVARVVMTVFYFTVFVPFGLGVRMFSDPLDMGANGSQGWKPRQSWPTDLEDFRRLS